MPCAGGCGKPNPGYYKYIYMYKFNGENDGRIDLRILAPVPVPAWLSLHWHHRIVDVAWCGSQNTWRSEANGTETKDSGDALDVTEKDGQIITLLTEDLQKLHQAPVLQGHVPKSTSVDEGWWLVHFVKFHQFSQGAWWSRLVATCCWAIFWCGKLNNQIKINLPFEDDFDHPFMVLRIVYISIRFTVPVTCCSPEKYVSRQRGAAKRRWSRAFRKASRRARHARRHCENRRQIPWAAGNGHGIPPGWLMNVDDSYRFWANGPMGLL